MKPRWRRKEQLDKDLLQDGERAGGNDRCAKTSQGYDEDCSRS